MTVRGSYTLSATGQRIYHSPGPFGPEPSGPPPPPAATRPVSGAGIPVSLGPAENPNAPKNEIFTFWCTLPLTPTSLPIAEAGLWQDHQVLGGGTRSTFGGPDESTLAFSGQLEPPAMLTNNSRAAGLGSLATLESGAIELPREESQVIQEQWGPGAGSAPPIQGVVPQDGGQAGYTQWVEPTAFNDMFRKAVKAGEIIRIIVGDEYGFNGLVSLRTYTWRYEDPDPDTLNFEFTAKSWAPQTAMQAQSQAHKSGVSNYEVRDGDTLRSIAKAKLHSSSDAAVHKLINTGKNAKTIGGLWVYPDDRFVPARYKVGKSFKGNTPRGLFESVGPKSVKPPPSINTFKPHEVGPQGGKSLSGDRFLRRGWKLQIP